MFSIPGWHIESGMSEIVLDVNDLAVTFGTGNAAVKAVDGVSFQVRRGEILGLVGESGSGKSVSSLAIMGLIDPPGKIARGSIKFEGRDIAGLPDRDMQTLRGRRIAMIFQDPMSTLNPVLRIDTQMIETIQAHENVSDKAARARARDALTMVGIPSPDERLLAYPHQFSGGMRQRVAIAIALLHRPSLILADEPTTALDVTIQAQILAEVQKLARETGTALVWVTHDLSVIASLADRVAVMYAGRIVEQGSVADVLQQPLHHYTAGLIGSVPSRNKRGQPLMQIPGMTPVLANLPPGCVFSPRCAARQSDCDQPQHERWLSAERMHRCAHPPHAAQGQSA